MPIYPDDEMIGQKSPINTSTFRRLQHNHPTKAAQLDQEDNQQGTRRILLNSIAAAASASARKSIDIIVSKKNESSCSGGYKVDNRSFTHFVC